MMVCVNVNELPSSFGIRSTRPQSSPGSSPHLSNLLGYGSGSSLASCTLIALFSMLAIAPRVIGWFAPQINDSPTTASLSSEVIALVGQHYSE